MSYPHQELVERLAREHSLSVSAVRALADAVDAGGGMMAQFSHPELGGSGQWMQGGMTMVGDMFNTGLKDQVNRVASELAKHVGRGGFGSGGSVSSQSQSTSGPNLGGSYQSQSSGSSHASGGRFWPEEFGSPASSGSQNQTRYAIFPQVQRLVIRDGDRVRIFDTEGYRVGGVSQQQGGGIGSMYLSTDRGTISADQLREIPETSADEVDSTKAKSESVRGASHEAVSTGSSPATSAAPQTNGNSLNAPQAEVSTIDPITALERLSRLRDSGVLTEEEFAAKKADLLSRI